MGLKQKFLALSGMMGVLLLVVSCIGYYTAYTNLHGQDGAYREKCAGIR